MPNLTHAEWSIHYHQGIIAELHQQLVLYTTPKDEIEQRIAENEQWVERWTERQKIADGAKNQP
jgi:hypothetical protein